MSESARGTLPSAAGAGTVPAAAAVCCLGNRCWEAGRILHWELWNPRWESEELFLRPWVRFCFVWPNRHWRVHLVQLDGFSSSKQHSQERRNRRMREGGKKWWTKEGWCAPLLIRKLGDCCWVSGGERDVWSSSSLCKSKSKMSARAHKTHKLFFLRYKIQNSLLTHLHPSQTYIIPT